MTFLTPVTPNDPKSKFESISFVKGLKLVYHHKSRDTYNVCCMRRSIFSENELLTHVTPNDPKSKFESISFVKGLKFVNIPESRNPAM